MNGQPPDQFGSWTHSDELRWEIELLRGAISADSTVFAHRPPLSELSDDELEAEHLRLRRVLWVKLNRPATNLPNAGSIHTSDSVRQRAQYTSPYSYQEIWERSG